ncbi:hypothetical protein D3C74_425840 [compost metagenome]
MHHHFFVNLLHPVILHDRYLASLFANVSYGKQMNPRYLELRIRNRPFIGSRFTTTNNFCQHFALLI